MLCLYICKCNGRIAEETCLYNNYGSDIYIIWINIKHVPVLNASKSVEIMYFSGVGGGLEAILDFCG